MNDHKLRKARVLFKGEEAGVLEETATGYRFIYRNDFAKKNIPISVTFPTSQLTYENPVLFPFFVRVYHSLLFPFRVKWCSMNLQASSCLILLLTVELGAKEWKSLY